MEILHRSSGVLHYSRGESGGYKLVVSVDPEITRFYRSLIPKWVRTNPQKYAPHISVVRKETPVVMDRWGEHEGKEVDFVYSPMLQRGTVYWWLNAFSKRLEEIRTELGLPVDSPFTRPPDGLAKTFHTTLGNMKPHP